MSTFDDDYESTGSDSGPKALRDALEKAQEQNKQLADRLAKFEQREREVQLGKALESKGLNPKIAGLIPADADPEKWVDEFGGLFAPTTPGGEPAAEAGSGGEAGTTVTEADQNALSVQGSLASGGQPAGDAGQALSQRIAGAKSSEEVLAIMAEVGLA